jgi:transposase
MPVIGIDVAKDTLALFDTATGEISECANTKSALSRLIVRNHWRPENFIVGLESTGDYSLVPAQTFLDRDFTVKLLNPIVTKKFLRATVRNKKTDRSDAEAIATIVRYGEGRPITLEELTLAKKTLIRLEQRLVKLAASVELLGQSVERKMTAGISLDTARDELDRLQGELRAGAKRLWKAAAASPATRQETIIASHPGCGAKLATIISNEAGDIGRFPSARQFKAYAGIDPRVIQSGQMEIHGHMTKRGNPILRHALFLAAFVATNHDPELRAYYRKKRDEGKSHTHAVCTIARKMCERIYATVTQNRSYEVRQLST